MPDVSKIRDDEWEVLFNSDLVTVERAEVYLVNVIGSEYEICSHDTHGAFETDFYRITNVRTGVEKVIYGETAWMDARRFAGDLDLASWGSI